MKIGDQLKTILKMENTEGQSAAPEVLNTDFLTFLFLFFNLNQETQNITQKTSPEETSQKYLNPFQNILRNKDKIKGLNSLKEAILTLGFSERSISKTENSGKFLSNEKEESFENPLKVLLKEKKNDQNKTLYNFINLEKTNFFEKKPDIKDPENLTGGKQFIRFLNIPVSETISGSSQNLEDMEMPKSFENLKLQSNFRKETLLKIEDNIPETGNVSQKQEGKNGILSFLRVNSQEKEYLPEENQLYQRHLDPPINKDSFGKRQSYQIKFSSEKEPIYQISKGSNGKFQSFESRTFEISFREVSEANGSQIKENSDTQNPKRIFVEESLKEQFLSHEKIKKTLKENFPVEKLKIEKRNDPPGEVCIQGTPDYKMISEIKETKNMPNQNIHSVAIRPEEVPLFVKEMVVKLHPHGRHEAHLKLHPPELGELHLSVSVDRGEVKLLLTVEHPRAAETLQQHLKQLETAFEGLGLQFGGAEINLTAGGENSSGETFSFVYQDVPENKESAEEKREQYKQNNSLIDIRI